MGCGYSNAPVRDLREGVVSFEGWDGLNEHERLAAKAFEEGLENGFAVQPPSLTVDFTLTDEDVPDDVTLTVSLDALGKDYDGPQFRFSLKDALTGFQCGKKDATDLLRAFEAVIAHAKAEIDKMPERGLNPFGSKAEARIIGHDGNEVHNAAKEMHDEFVRWVAPLVEKHIRDAMKEGV